MTERTFGILEGTRERIFGPRRVVFNNGLLIVASITGPEPTVTLQDGSKVLLDFKSFALINARGLERQFGIDIIPQMGGIDGALRYVRSFVEQYEQFTKTEFSEVRDSCGALN